MQKKAHSALAAPDEEAELDRLYRFQEIPVSADMRRELLGAKLPLASADQLADTQPPFKSALSVPAASAMVDRHAPTELAVADPARSPDQDFEKGEPPLADTGRYSTTAPTLLSVRRRRLRNQRLVGLAFAAMILAIFSGAAWKRYTRQHDATTRTASTAAAQAPGIGGNRPARPAQRPPDAQAGDPIEGHEGHEAHEAHEPPREGLSEISGTGSKNAQLNAAEADATSSSPLSASAGSAASDPPRATTKSPTAPPEGTLTSAGTPATQKGTNAPSKPKPFDPEELIF